jgi:hypothetical protein
MDAPATEWPVFSSTPPETERALSHDTLVKNTAQKKREILLDALKIALSQAGEHRLFRAGRLNGLFPSKHGESGDAAREALSAGLLDHVRTETRGKFFFEWVKSTAKTAGFVAIHDSPKAILRELNDVLGETRAGVPIWLDQAKTELRTLSNQFESRATAMLSRLDSLTLRIDDALRRADAQLPERMGSQAVRWSELVLKHLDTRRDSGSAECPLSELFQVIAMSNPELTVTEFIDGIKRLADVKALTLTRGQDDPEFSMVWQGKLCQSARRYY